MSEIEICCLAADRQRIDWLAHALAERGWSCGFAVERTPHAHVRCAIVVWTHEGRRAAVLKRVGRTARRRGILVSAMLDGVEAPRGFSGRASADLSAWPAKSADHAIDGLLDDVAFVVANPKVARERRDIGDTVVVATVAVLFVGLLYTLMTRERDGTSMPQDSAGAAAVPSPIAVTPSPPASQPSPTNIPPPTSLPPATVATETIPPAEQAAALGREAIATLGRVLAGDSASADEAKQRAYAALRLDPTEPNARLVHAICIALLDGAWTDAARTIHGIDPAFLSEDAVQLAARWHLLHGDVPAAGNALAHGRGGDRTWEIADIERALASPIEPHAPPPLCTLLDDTDQATTVDAYEALTPGERLALLGEPCFVTRVAVSQTTRTLLGIGIQRD